MGYRERTLPVDFSDLGEDCWVEIGNPALEPLDGRAPAKDTAENLARGRERLVRLIRAWKMWDVTVDADELLPLPSEDPTALDRCPQMVWQRIGEVIAERTLPLAMRGSENQETRTSRT